jgi:NAD-dependent SIR2 family protein deacetylase
MSFSTFSDEAIAALVDSAGSAPKLTIVVGAGASMEAGLPSWETLVNRLLRRVASERALLDVADARAVERWEAEAARDGYLGAAAIVDALAGDERDRWIYEELFRQERRPHDVVGPKAYFPGPITRQIAHLARVLGGDLRIITLNYDDLIEQALRDEGLKPAPVATDQHRHGEGAVPVFHVHGYFGRDGGETGQIVLSEADYQRMLARGSWQDDLVRTALRDSVVIFLGTSLIDPNLIRYLHGASAETGEAFALFVRQGTYPKDVPPAIPAAREQALSARWRALNVAPVFVDHYVDVAQIIYEVAHRAKLGSRYLGLADRSREWVETVQREILGTTSDEAFVHAQEAFRALLRSSLDAAIAAVEALTDEAFDETLACSLWLVDADGEHLTSWVTTDRLHVERATIEPVPVGEHSRWVAVRAFCRGVPLAEPRDVYASRWHFIRGTPLVLEDGQHGRIPVGCLTTSSMRGRDDSRLATMDADVATEFNDALARQVLRFLNRPFTAAAGATSAPAS